MQQNNNSHLTAKTRTKLSFPASLLMSRNLLKGSILDFGCGLGSDVKFLNDHNFSADGYDPFYFPDYPQKKYDTILCLYVLNVLFSEEQSQVIMRVSELLNPGGTAYFAVRRDIRKEGFRRHKIHNKDTYQTNVVLPFESIFLNENCEIYKYSHFNQLKHESGCIFCNPASDFELVTESALFYAVYDKFPVTNGHVLIIPKRHSRTFFELSFKEQIASVMLINRVKDILKERFNSDGFNVGFNCEAASGQTVFHTHIHVIPRYTGDMEDPRGGVRNVIPAKGNYLKADQEIKK